VSRLIPVQVGFDRLLPHYNPWTACELLNTALRKNHVRLWRDGVLLSPTDIRDGDLYARVEFEADSRWLCTIESRQPQRAWVVDVDDTGERQLVTVVLPQFVWEVDTDGITALLPALSGKRPGRKAVHNWTDIVDGELRALQYKGSPLLENPSELEAHLLAHLEQETGQPFKSTKRFRQRIRGFLGVQN
jgi:hypothetical protein